MEPVRIDALRLAGVLSFAPESAAIELDNLNILIGANGAGKSNIIDALAFLAAAPRDLPAYLRSHGGARSWLHRRGDSVAQEGVVEATVSGGALKRPLRHRVAFGLAGEHFRVHDERIENADVTTRGKKPFLYFGYERGRPMIKRKGAEGPRELRAESVDPSQSILAQRREPDEYPEIFALASTLERARFYRSWSFGPLAPQRMAAPTDLRSDALDEDGQNLPLVLARLRTTRARDPLLRALSKVTEGATDFDVTVSSGRAELSLIENGSHTAALRLSDGTLRYLALLTILLDPSPPPLICIDEPELGLHPDLLPTVADLLRDASRRTQIVATTHSDVLVDCFSESPEVIAVVDRERGMSRVRRLSRRLLSRWLHEYRNGGPPPALGDLWTRGQIGGTRW